MYFRRTRIKLWKEYKEKFYLLMTNPSILVNEVINAYSIDPCEYFKNVRND